MTSLRARKKQATARGLATSAYHLALEQGLDSLTTERIANRTGVSRRTFANYYPNKYAAVVDGFLHALGVPIQRPGDSICADSVPMTFTGLIGVIEKYHRDVFNDPARVRHLQDFAAMMRTHPVLEPHLHALFYDFENSELHQILESRFGQVKISIFLGAVLGSLSGAIRVLLGPLAHPQPDGVAATPPILSDADLTTVFEHIDRAFTYLRHGFMNPEKDLPRA